MRDTLLAILAVVVKIRAPIAHKRYKHRKYAAAETADSRRKPSEVYISKGWPS